MLQPMRTRNWQYAAGLNQTYPHTEMNGYLAIKFFFLIQMTDFHNNMFNLSNL